MKRLIVAAATLSLLLGTSLAFAQTSPDTTQTQGPARHKGMHGQAMSPENRLNHLSQKLGLTDDQKAKIKPLLEQENQKMQALHNENSTARQEQRTKMMQIHKDTFDQIRPMLNPDQQAKLDTLMKNQQERMAHARGRHGQANNTGAATQPANPQ